MRRLVRKIQADFKARQDEEAVRKQWRDQGWVYVRGYTVAPRVRKYVPPAPPYVLEWEPQKRLKK
jgi:hypothetical protein